MSGYIGAQPVPQATQHREAFTATASQTSFATVGYTPQFVDVYLNGVKLAAADYTATNGSDIVLTTGAALDDILEYVAYTPFEVASQTFTGTTTVDALVATGNVGIGTASTIASADFTVNSATSTRMNLASDGVERFGVFADSGIAALYAGGTSVMTLSTNAAERLRIDTSGNVLVGKTATDFNTQGFEINSGGQLRNSRASGSVAFLNRKTDDGSIVDFGKDGTVVGSIGTSYGAIALNGASAVNLNDGTNEVGFGSLAFAGNGSGNDAVIDLGRNNRRFKDAYLSGGIYLGGTAAANKLDSYEQGTWTPTVVSGTIVTSSACTYTKIGRLVHLTGANLIFSDYTSTATLQIENLPFTPSTGSMTGSVMAQHRDNNIGLTAFTSNSTAAVKFYYSSSTSSYAPARHNMFNNASGNIYFSIAYLTDA